MIYSILEFCLNSINGPFHSTPEHILGCRRYWVYTMPYLSLYVAFVGIRTPTVSFMMAQTLLLFRLINLADMTVIKILSARTAHNSPLNLLLRGLLNPAFISVGVTLLLHVFYQIKFRRSIAMAGRVSHAICFLVTRVLFSGRAEILVFNFLFNKLVMQVCIRIYVRCKKTFCIVVLAFIGTYYFLKTIGCCWNALSDLAYFEFILWRRSVGWRTLLVSYTTFCILFVLSFASQNILVDADNIEKRI